MNKTELMNTLSRSFSRTGLKIKKYSPEILVGAGIVGVVASAVMACKATTKVETLLSETKDTINKVHVMTEKAMADETIDYTAEDSKKDLAIIYTKAGVEFAKLYGPAVVLGTVSIASILAGHNILRKRNVALAAAYTVIDKSFKEYRGRVIERFGKELDHELRYNIQAKEVEELVVNEETGETEVVKKTVQMADPSAAAFSEYAVFFTDGCNGWEKDPELSKMFLLRQQEYANQRLQKKGHVFLNEVYDLLGINRTKAGQHVGWVYDEEHPSGDNYIDFGIFNPNNERSMAFVNGWESTILLDFNVDGDILDLI